MPKPATPRTIRACKVCRSLKVRCLPSAQGDVCQKCTRSGAECLFENQKPRRKREKPDSRARVAALESKLEDLIAQVSQSNITSSKDDINTEHSGSIIASSSTSPSNSKRSERTPHSPTTADQLPTPESQTRDHPSLHHLGGNVRHGSSSECFVQFLDVGATPQALISQGCLSSEDVELHIATFRELCSYFPFVTIPLDTTMHSMLKDRPLLLHAALAVSTSSDVHLQKVLEKSFKELMLKKLFIEAQKSIDLLQSILICVAWGHFFHIPKRDQTYQLLQMAVGLCVDLGLNLTPSFAMQKKLGLHLDHYQPQGEIDDDRFWSREARRAYLGCYHVSTMISWIWAKPNTIEYSDYILQCARSISDDPEDPIDELVLPLVQLQAIGEEYHKVLRVGRHEVHTPKLLDRIGAHVRSFRKRIAEVKSSLTPTAASSPAIQLSFHFAAVYAFEQDLLSPFTSVSRLMATGAPTNPMEPHIDSPSRIDILLDCLGAAVSYLDLFLTLPVSLYPCFGTSQWSGLIYSTVLVYRLSIGTPRVPLWDVQVARETVKLERYLKILFERLQEATRDRLRTIVGTHNRDLYSVMGLIMQNVRHTYEILRTLPQEQSTADDRPVHATTFPDEAVEEQMPHLQPRPGPIFRGEGLQPRMGYQNRCPALQFWTTPDSMGCSAEMLGDDPFLNMNTIDDDEFWSEAFADMARVGEQWIDGVDMGIASS